MFSIIDICFLSTFALSFFVLLPLFRLPQTVAPLLPPLLLVRSSLSLSLSLSLGAQGDLKSVDGLYYYLLQRKSHGQSKAKSRSHNQVGVEIRDEREEEEGRQSLE